MPHTKRTPEFLQKVVSSADKLEVQRSNGEVLKLGNGEIDDLLYILRECTTDSPCIVKAAEDEPIFVLRGQDETADHVVRVWAERARTVAANLTEIDPRYPKLLAKADDALVCATEMVQYPKRKRPD